MDAIRQIVTPATNYLKIKIPDNLVHEKLEVIILPLVSSNKIDTTYTSLMGSISENDAKMMLQYVEASRNELE